MKHTCIVICLWALTFPATASSQTGSRVPSVPAALQLQSVPYKTATSMRTAGKRNMLILWLSLKPEDFVRDRMLILAHQLKQDFPDEPRIYAVIFDSEAAVRHYNPAGGSYYISKKLERGEYYLDRVKGQEYINFSLKPGNPVDEIKIGLSNKPTTSKKRQRALR